MSIAETTVAAGFTKRFNLPLCHLEPDYIRKCTDTRELEKIYKVLKSGDEGFYPHLDQICEDRLSELNPASRVLRKESKPATKGDIEKEEWQEIDRELTDWSSDMKYMEGALKKDPDTNADEESDLPPIRTGTITLTSEGAKSSRDTEEKSNKRVKPREYREWDKIDIDKELEKVDNPDKKDPPPRTVVSGRDIQHIATTVDATGLTDGEKLMKANREKDKGNEAFKANDFKEAIVYYSRSISLQPTAASYNNRALAYLKSSEWAKAVQDCSTVLKLEPDNVKALLRRGTARKGNKQFGEAKKDIETVLSKEPNNKRAKELLADIHKAAETDKEERRTKGRRMVIEDVDGASSGDEGKDVGSNVTSTVNGVNGAKQGEVKERRKMVIEDVGSDSEEDEEKPETGNGSLNGVSFSNGNNDIGQKTVLVDRETESKDIWNAEDIETAEQMSNRKSPVGQSANQKPVIENSTHAHRRDVHMERTRTDGVSSGRDSPEAAAVVCEDNVQQLKPSPSGASGERLSTENTESKDNAINDRLEDKKLKEKDSSADTRVVKRPEMIVAEKQDLTVAQKPEMTVAEKGDATAAENIFRRPRVVQKPWPAKAAPLREEGNTLFRNGQYADASQKYSKVIELLESEKDQKYNLSLIYSNRAACELKKGELPAAVRDCTKSLDLVPHSVKPLLRRAQAYEHLERFRLAYVDYRHALLLDSNIEQGHLGTKRCQSMLNQTDGSKWRDKVKLQQVSPWEVPEIVDESDEPIFPSQPTFVPQSSPQSSSNQPSPSNQQSPSNQPSPSNQQSPSNKPVASSQSASDAKSAPSNQPTPKSTSDVKTEKGGGTARKTLSPQEQFEKSKAEGNDFVKKGEFRAAVKSYSQCVELLPDQTVSFTNRALCYLRLNQPSDAEADCTKALKLDSDNVKALFRRGQARKMLKLYRDGIEDLKHLLQVDPNNTAAKKEMELIKNYWRKELNDMKKDMPDAVAKETGGKAKTEGAGLPGKQRKRMVIEEVDSEDEETDVKPAATGSKGASEEVKQESKTSHPPKKRVEVSVNSKPDNKSSSKQSKSKTTDSKSVQSKTDGKPVQNKGDSKQTKGKGKTIKQTSSGLPKVRAAVPKLDKATPYEFISAWNTLKSSESVKPYYDLMKQISPADIPTVISNKLDGQMLTVITRCVAEHYIANGEQDDSYQILQMLSTVPRFQTIAMFMTQKEKERVKLVMQKLGEHNSSVYSTGDVQTLRKLYSV